jgi:hypothetical protein
MILIKKLRWLRYRPFNYLALGICASAFSSCTREATESHVNITNSILSTSTQFPSVVLIKTGDGSGETCTGTFIGSRTVLTAAHCLPNNQMKSGLPAGKISVFIGGSNGREVPADGVYFPKWAGKMNMPIDGYDIAVITLREAAAPAISAVGTKKVSIGESFMISGYGMLSHEKELYDADYNDNLELYYGRNQVLATNEHYIFAVGESDFEGGVASGLGSIIAPGDSGGPLFIDDKVVGTASWTPPFRLTVEDFEKIRKSHMSRTPSPASIAQDGWAHLSQIPNLDTIMKRVQRGERLGFSAHLNITLPVYQQWLKSLKSQGLDIKFENESNLKPQ